jgi:hypothetical protein
VFLKEGDQMRKFAALLVALVVGGGIVVGVTASQAGASSEFTLDSHVTNIEFITSQVGPSTSIPSSPMVPGDRVLTRGNLTQNGSPVGYLVAMCTLTFNNNFMCESTLALTNRGDIHVSILARASQPSVLGFPTVYDVIVDGGTFAFRNAHGSAHVVVSPNLLDATDTFALG